MNVKYFISNNLKCQTFLYRKEWSYHCKTFSYKNPKFYNKNGGEVMLIWSINLCFDSSPFPVLDLLKLVINTTKHSNAIISEVFPNLLFFVFDYILINTIYYFVQISNLNYMLPNLKTLYKNCIHKPFIVQTHTIHTTQ